MICQSNGQSKQQKKRPRKKRGQSNRECGIGHCREIESSLVLARPCQKRKGRPNWLQEEWPTSSTDFEYREVKSGPSHFARQPMVREQCALLVEEQAPCVYLFSVRKEAALPMTVSPVYIHIMSHIATICQGITIFCFHSQHLDYLNLSSSTLNAALKRNKLSTILRWSQSIPMYSLTCVAEASLYLIWHR